MWISCEKPVSKSAKNVNELISIRVNRRSQRWDSQETMARSRWICENTRNKSIVLRLCGSR
jgi:hypothetical protein